MGGRSTCLLPALLLLVIPGSSAISGPRAERGVEQASLTVRCRYDPGYESYLKWWCRGADWGSCRIMVKTTGSEKEVKKGRMSIRDNQKDRSFTVTMEKLRLDDSDTYWCGLEKVGTDLGSRVEVTIDPAPTVSIPTPATSTSATSNANMLTAPVAPEENQGQLPLPGSVHFLLLVFLKVPLLLGLLGAVLWVNRPLRSSGGEPQENQQPPWSSTLSREKDPQTEEKGISCRHLERSPGDRATRLPAALLLLCVPGCLSLSGPQTVTGIVGGSLSVECQYQEALVDNIKYWCKHPCVSPWKIVETRESERKVRRGRVSIRDRPASLTFTVTLKSLREEDAGTYGCGIYVPFSVDPTFQVEVSVIPVTMTTTSPKRSTSTSEAPTTLPVPTWSTVSGPEAPDPGQAHRPLLGSIHFLLLVFLKVPLLLGLISAVLWVNRPLRSSADRRSRSVYENQ
ncbi:unnamed protein product [Rangifer tarandus platyrhynchus]|uniref:Uncharacterized protein n=1 Tax=Rangifer tarandus platyrhynchus TaxID=3082113 RepID=A0AC59Z0Y7_RANTA